MYAATSGQCNKMIMQTYKLLLYCNQFYIVKHFIQFHKSIKIRHWLDFNFAHSVVYSLPKKVLCSPINYITTTVLSSNVANWCSKMTMLFLKLCIYLNNRNIFEKKTKFTTLMCSWFSIKGCLVHKNIFLWGPKYNYFTYHYQL